MNRGRKRRFIHLLAVFWMLTAGICVDCSQAYSVLACHDSFEPARCSFDSANSFTSDEICTSDLLGYRTVVKEAQAPENTGIKGRAGIRGALTVPELISQVSQFYYSMVCIRQYQEVRSHTLIMNYIHNKDGQKSLSL